MRTLAFILFSYLSFNAFLCILTSALLLNYPQEYHNDTSKLCRTGHDNVSRTRMRSLVFILSKLFPLDGFRCNFVSALYIEYPLVFYHDISQLCKTGHVDVSRTRRTTLAFILSELFPLDGFRCIFSSAL